MANNPRHNRYFRPCVVVASRESARVLSQDETKGDGAAPSRYPKPRQDK